MQTGSGVRLGRPAADLRERWAAEALCSGWPAAADAWPCTAVDLVCEALVTSGPTAPDLHAAARALGVQRAEVGTRLHEARADLDIALGLAQLSRRKRSAMLDILAVAWAEHAADRGDALTISEGGTETATRGYLVLRLGELYREAALTGTNVATRHLLVAVETVEAADRLVADAWLSAVHSALRYAFVGGETIAVVSSRRVVVLAGRDEPRLSESLARLRSELKIALAEGRLPGVRLWRQALPHAADELPLALGEVVE